MGRARAEDQNTNSVKYICTEGQKQPWFLEEVCAFVGKAQNHIVFKEFI